MRSGEQPCPFDVWAPSDFFFHHLSRGRANSGAQSVLGPPRDVTVAVLGEGVGRLSGSQLFAVAMAVAAVLVCGCKPGSPLASRGRASFRPATASPAAVCSGAWRPAI